MSTATVSEKARVEMKNFEVSASSTARDCYLHPTLVLSAILALERQGKHCWGPTEGELRDLVKLTESQFDVALGFLLERVACVQHRWCQKGTAGPFAHRYAVAPSLKITVSWEERSL